MQEKQCGRCSVTKDIVEFWKNHTKKDGHNSICRECYKGIDKKRYYENHVKSKKAKNKIAKDMQKKYPEKWKARSLLRYAVKIGQRKKQPCEVCGNPKVEGHHQDYTKPLEVNWVCIKHHREKYHRK